MHDDIIVLEALKEMKQAIISNEPDTTLKRKQIASACHIAFSKQSSTRKTARYMEDIVSLANSIRVIAEFLVEKDFNDKNGNIKTYANCYITSKDVLDFLKDTKIIVES